MYSNKIIKLILFSINTNLIVSCDKAVKDNIFMINKNKKAISSWKRSSAVWWSMKALRNRFLFIGNTFLLFCFWETTARAKKKWSTDYSFAICVIVFGMHLIYSVILWHQELFFEISALRLSIWRKLCRCLLRRRNKRQVFVCHGQLMFILKQFKFVL